MQTRKFKRMILITPIIAAAIMTAMILFSVDVMADQITYPQVQIIEDEGVNGQPGASLNPAGREILAPGTCAGSTPPPSYLTRTHTTTHFRIHYTLDNTNYPDDAMANSSQPDVLGDDLEDAWDAYSAYGFADPVLNSDGYVEVYVYDHGAWGSTSPSWDCIQVEVNRVRESTGDTRKGSPHHELFHRTEFEYDSGEAGWVIEGAAKFMEDKVFTDIDNNSGSAFMNRVNTYLADPDMGLQNAGYNAALFWTYFTEVYGGSPTSEPGYHADAMVEFWEAAATVDGRYAVADAMSELGYSKKFESLFADFILANYVKDYNYASEFAYVDDDATPFDGVNIEFGTQSIDSSSSLSHPGQSVSSWGADYYEAIPSASDCTFVNASADGDPGANPIYHIVTVNGTDVTKRYSTVAEDVSRTFYNGSGQVERIALIVGARLHSQGYDVEISCLVPSLTIVHPTSTAYAYAGEPTDPDKILVMVEVTADGSYVEGLEPATFGVQVGGLDADILSAAYVQHQYWLLVRPPTQSSSTWYDLTVSLEGLVSATETNAVLYVPRPEVDELLVIDVSGSMSDENKLGAAKNAARLFVDVSATDDYMGVVTYSTSADLEMPLTPLSFTNKVSAKALINSLNPLAQTCIGCGVQTAQDELDANGASDHWWNVILLSDGMENIAPYWDDVKADVLASQTVIHTVFLGPADDDAEELMQRIADEAHNGTYNRVYLESESPTTYEPILLASNLPHASSPLSVTLPNRIADVYKGIRESVEHQDRIYQEVGMVGGPGGSNNPVVRMIPIDPGIPELLFTVNWSSGGLNIIIRRPDGSVVNVMDPDVIELITDPTHAVYRMSNPQEGIWTVEMALEPGSELVEYLLVADGDTDVDLDVYLGLAPEERWVGTPMPILASLSDHEVITGANVLVNISQTGTFTISGRLFDDGLHADGIAGDGIYGIPFRQTRSEGSYRAVIHATGISHNGHPFSRWKTVYFFMKGDEDNDQDGMPDNWEKRFGFNPTLPDGDQDADYDALTNLHEFNIGANPRKSDTDGGGEHDGSEVIQGGDPHSPDDDQVKPSGHLWTLPGNGFNVIRFDRVPGADRFILYRAVLPAPGVFEGLGALSEFDFVPIDTNVPPNGIYTDTTVTNDTPYLYMISAVNPLGNQSDFTAPALAVPRIDTIPPVGELLINGGALETRSREVNLEIYASPDTVSMMVGNDPAFPNASWEPFSPSLIWTLPGKPGHVLVFARLKDAAGNESELLLDGIFYKPGLNHYLPLVRK